MKKYLVLLFLTLAPLQFSYAQTSCRLTYSDIGGKSFVTDALSHLQNLQNKGGKVLGVQPDFDGYIQSDAGGACATVTAFNLLQGIREAKGFETRLKPEKIILESFRKQPKLLTGKVTNEDMQSLFIHFSKYLPKVKYKMRTETFSEKDLASDSLLQLSPGEFKILTYKFIDFRGQVIGRHFVILKKGLQDGKIEVIDPSRPEKTYFYEIHKNDGDIDGDVAFELVDGRSRMRTFVVDTVFTITVQ